MGFFSFFTTDKGNSISNTFSDRGVFDVYMIDNKGNSWKENNYEGYGVFGGKDIFVLIAEMNGINLPTEDEMRDAGHELFYKLKADIILPNLNEEEGLTWVNKKLIECPDQGYFYDNEDDDYDEEENEDY